MINRGVLHERELELFRHGDAEFFRRLVETYSPRLMAVTMSYAVDHDDGRDLLQETWLRAYQKRKQFAGRGTVIGWLYSVCRTVCLDAVARRQARDRLAPGMPPPLRSFATDDRAHRSELKQSLYDALTELPTRERDVAILRLLEGYSTRETARRLGCAEGTVKATLSHAIQKLKTAMEVWVS